MCLSENLFFEIAEKSNMSLKYACIITLRNKIISTGFNYYDLSRLGSGTSCLL
jgi:hypothetical protein